MFELVILVSCLLLLGLTVVGTLCVHTRRQKNIDDRVHTMATAGRIAVGMAHDLNNLLGAIMGKAELLSRGQYFSNAKAASEEIVKLCESAARMTHYVLSLMQPKFSEIQEVDAAEHIRELETVLKAISGRTVQLRIYVAPSSVGVKIPPSEIDQLLVNLVLNAREAGAANIRINVTTGYGEAKDRCWLNIVVVDDGPGMNGFVLARATEEQFSDKPSGTGVGLSTVKRIAEASGGVLELGNAPEGGAFARVVLPCETTLTDPTSPLLEQSC